MGYAYEEVEAARMRFDDEGIWVAIRRDPVTGLLQTASHNRNNSAATAGRVALRRADVLGHAVPAVARQLRK